MGSLKTGPPKTAEDPLLRDLAAACAAPPNRNPAIQDLKLAAAESLFARLAGREDWRLLPAAVQGLLHGDPRVGASSAAAAAALLERCPARSWPWLDQQVRRAWALGDRQTYGGSYAAQAAIVDRLALSSSERGAALILLACHNNGFVRQKAVGELARAPRRESLAVLTLRMDDWVEPVRASAFAGFSALLREEHLGLLIDSLSMMIRILARQRVDAGPARARLAAFFSTPAGRQALLKGLGSRRPGVARSCLEALLQLEPKPDGWQEAALRSKEAWVRHRALALSIEAAGDRLRERLLAMAGDVSTRIRHQVLDAAEELFPELLESLATSGLQGRSPGLRRRCQNLMVLRYDRDPLLFYRAEFTAPATPATPSRLEVALLGLAETGDHHELAFFEDHLTAPAARVRAAAVAGWSRLEGDAASSRLFAFLADPSARVRRSAEAALARLSWPAELLAATYRSSDQNGRRAALRLLVRLAPWERLLLALEAHADPDPLIRQEAGHHVGSLSVRGWTLAPPTGEQRRAIAEALASPAYEISAYNRTMLQFLLRTGSG